MMNDTPAPSPPRDPNAPPARGARRRFLEVLVNGLLAIPLLGPVVFAGFVVGQRGKKRKRIEVDTLPIGKIPKDGVAQHRLHYRRQHGAFLETVERMVYLRQTDDGVIALSAECTHLGCNVQYDGENKKLLCPCHKGIFKLDGSVESGPPPAPLQRYEVVTPTDTSKPIRIKV